MEAKKKPAKTGPLVPTLKSVDYGVFKLGCCRVSKGDEWELIERFVNGVLALNNDQHVTSDEDSSVDPLTALLELLVSQQDHRDICADLLAAAFAGCAVHKDLKSLAHQFACSIAESHTLGSLLRELCGTVNLAPDYKPGVYSVVAKLNLFEHPKTSILRSLNMALGSVLRTVWVPLWSYETLPDLYSCVLSQNLLLATTQEHKLDFIIASREHDVLRWHELKDRKTTSLNFFLLRVARRAIQCRNYVSNSFAEFSHKILSQAIGNECFMKVENSNVFTLSVFMEIVDHPDLNFLEEPHLTFLLNCALRQTRNLCENGQIETLHMELGTMGSTLSLFGLANILQYILARFLVDTGNLMFSAPQFSSDKRNWALRQSPYELPRFFDQVVPDIPPISRASFGFDKRDSELPLQMSKFSDIILSILESLNHAVFINRKLLMFYGREGIDLSLDFRGISQEKHINLSQVVGTKSKSEIFELFFVAITSVLLLSRQLHEGVYFWTLMDEQEAEVQSRIMTPNALNCFEALVSTLDGASLYEFIGFSNRISLIDLNMHAVSMQVLSHILFESALNVLQGSTPTKKLILDALYNHIILWNDGTDTYGRFMTEIFKTEVLPVAAVSFSVSGFLNIMFPRDSAQALPMESASPLFKTGDSTEFRKNYQTAKYNAHANSFVPSSRPQHVNTEGENAMPQGEHSHPSSRPAEIFQPSNSAVEGFNLHSSFSTGRQQLTNANEHGTTFSGTAPRSLSNLNSWSPNCFSQGPLSSPETGPAVSTGKNYILGGHNRAANNSRAQSVHVDRFNYIQQ
ncbi:Vir1p LALA0_S10e03444g [Lachancea lanzarotensis]|uniref:LALA0S10e03444g1_1 n=1 Tax=Lachancea lanzarotensis TaxID=1245769 RepID=A0A0C7N1V2_9SACH|nr:uncharacterized protein LALA0_S10e03444g [Lachancea lanzarotensis]CEP64144.1 LALA0S10e03444g1_1 [Lachancea lanzarotensis]